MALQRMRSSSGALMLSMLGFGCYSLYLGQDANWDLRNYHWYNAYAFLHDRLGFDIAPAQLQTYLNPLLDLPFYAMVHVVREPRVIAFLMGAIHGIGVFFLYRILVELLPFPAPERWGYLLVGIAIGVTGTAALPVVGSTMMDTGVAAFVMAALCLMLRCGAAERPGGAGVAGSGLLAGIVTGLKLPAVIYAVSLGFALLAAGRNHRDTLRSALVFGSAATLGFLLSMGHWMWELYTHFESPLFPFFNRVFASPYAEAVNIGDRRFGPSSLTMWILFPFYLMQQNVQLVGELPGRDARLAAVASATVLAGLAALVRRRSPPLERLRAEPWCGPELLRRWRMLGVFFASAYALWLGVNAIYRYAIPIELLTGCVIVILSLSSFRSPRIRAVWLAIVTSIVLSTSKYPSWWRTSFGTRYFQVEVPDLPGNSLVVMLGPHPMSYLIPHFDPGARFVSPSNNLTHPNHRNALQLEIHRVIARHVGPLFSLDPRGAEESEQILERLGLAREGRGCTAIVSNIDPGTVQLCRLRHVGQSRAPGDAKRELGQQPEA